LVVAISRGVDELEAMPVYSRAPRRKHGLGKPRICQAFWLSGAGSRIALGGCSYRVFESHRLRFGTLRFGLRAGSSSCATAAHSRSRPSWHELACARDLVRAIGADDDRARCPQPCETLASAGRRGSGPRGDRDAKASSAALTTAFSTTGGPSPFGVWRGAWRRGRACRRSIATGKLARIALGAACDHKDTPPIGLHIDGPVSVNLIGQYGRDATLQAAPAPSAMAKTSMTSERRKVVITAQLDEVELQEGWSEVQPEIGFRFGLAVSAANGCSSSQVICVSIEPGRTGGRHAHSAEEVFLVLEGTAELAVGDERERVSAGGMAVIPATVPHDPHNVGAQTLRFLAIFPSAAVLHTWDVPVMPIGGRMFVTPPPDEEDGQGPALDGVNSDH
jgi:quercetin dioxygenase-like cupin family protein